MDSYTTILGLGTSVAKHTIMFAHHIIWEKARCRIEY